MTKKGRSFLKEFKTFIARGNVLDLAVAVVIGTAFNKIVTSFVNDLIMPALCLLTGKASFADLKWCVKEAITLTEDGEVLDQSTYIIYGAFLQAVIDFLLIAFSVFIMIKVVNNVRKKLEQVTEALPGLKKSPEEIAAEEAALAAAAISSGDFFKPKPPQKQRRNRLLWKKPPLSKTLRLLLPKLSMRSVN